MDSKKFSFQIMDEESILVLSKPMACFVSVHWILNRRNVRVAPSNYFVRTILESIEITKHKHNFKREVGLSSVIRTLCTASNAGGGGESPESYRPLHHILHGAGRTQTAKTQEPDTATAYLLKLHINYKQELFSSVDR